MKNKQRLYLVKREVLATSIKAAMTAPGKIYAIELADEKYQPTAEVSNVGFKNKS